MLRRSLQRKLLAVMLLTTLVAVVVAVGAMVTYDLRSSHQRWVDAIVYQADLLGRTTAPALAFDDAKVAQENLALLRHQPSIRAAAIYTAEGEVFASWLAEGEQDPPPPLPGADVVRVDAGRLHTFQGIVEDGQRLGKVYLRSAYPLAERMAGYAGIALLALLVSMLVALLVSYRLQRLVSRPVLAIAELAREVVQQRDYSRRAQKVSDDEVGVLAASFNDMLSEIEQRTNALEAAYREKEKLTEELEQRVHERTAQLERSNRELAVATQVAEKANRAKSEFLSSMSHELRTPLNAIIGFGQLLASENLPASAEQRRVFTEHIVRAGRHLLELINDILNLAQIEAGRVVLSMEPVSLDDVLGDCSTMIQPMCDKRSIRALFPQRCGLGAMADRTRLKQVLLNLLSNAVKYNRENGAVVVDCMRPAPGRVRVSVQDTGMGLTPEQVQALFQPFNRLGQEAGPEEGTGIGLVVTRHLVELMGGELGVNSTPGIGSVFWVELNESPETAAAPGESTRPRDEAAPSKDRHDDRHLATVLCVEDNPSNLDLVRQVLGFRADLRLLAATDGSTAVEMARVHLPQVILMDNNMPGLSGPEALRILRNDPRTASIPVIALTANAMPGAREQGLAAGFFRYLTKPIDVRELTDAVDSALQAVRKAT